MGINVLQYREFSAVSPAGWDFTRPALRKKSRRRSTYHSQRSMTRQPFRAGCGHPFQQIAGQPERLSWACRLSALCGTSLLSVGEHMSARQCAVTTHRNTTCADLPRAIKPTVAALAPRDNAFVARGGKLVHTDTLSSLANGPHLEHRQLGNSAANWVIF